MRRSGFLNHIARVAVAALGLTLGASAYGGEDPAADTAAEAKRHAEEMTKGKNHEEAAAAARKARDGDRTAKEAKRHAEEMTKGKNHEDATAAARGRDDEKAAKAAKRAKKHAEEMTKGRNHEDAAAASDKN